MAWSAKTQPTLANTRKRIVAAIEAIDGASALIEANPSPKHCALRTKLKNARAWLRDAEVNAYAR